MITGDIKNKIDQIWDTFFVAGITNPITVLEQMTYIFFMKLLDDKQLHEEENARDWGIEINLDIPLPPSPPPATLRLSHHPDRDSEGGGATNDKRPRNLARITHAVLV